MMNFLFVIAILLWAFCAPVVLAMVFLMLTGAA